MDQPIVTPQWPMLFDLASDWGELYNVLATKMDMGWMLGVALKFVADYQKSVTQYPNIKTGAEFTGYEYWPPRTPRGTAAWARHGDRRRSVSTLMRT